MTTVEKLAVLKLDTECHERDIDWISEVAHLFQKSPSNISVAKDERGCVEQASFLFFDPESSLPRLSVTITLNQSLGEFELQVNTPSADPDQHPPKSFPHIQSLEIDHDFHFICFNFNPELNQEPIIINSSGTILYS